ncbi:MAG: gas vesicle protein K [Chlorobaculum sp.]|nr:gas vesicle protein K [Chlorobaculum sp.]
MDEDRVLLHASTAEEALRQLEGMSQGRQSRIEANPDNVESGLARLVLTLIELLRKLVEKQAMRRIDGGSLDDEQIEKLGETLMKLEMKMEELKKTFKLTDKDLNLDLGPLGDLM